MRYRYIRDMRCSPSSRDKYPNGIIPKGTECDTPRGHRLVGMGVAEPLDDECRVAANKSQEQMEEAQKAYPRLEAGIEREDHEAFDFGAMTGYDPETGDWIEGPKFDEWQSLHNEDDDEEDEYDD